MAHYKMYVVERYKDGNLMSQQVVYADSSKKAEAKLKEMDSQPTSGHEATQAYGAFRVEVDTCEG